MAATCACAGIIVGVITKTGLALKFSSIVIDLAGGSVFWTALYTALIVWVVGLAVPVTASYIMCAVIAAPALIKLGMPDYAAHMFIFYYAVLSEVSPPTALSPFAAATIDPRRSLRHHAAELEIRAAGLPGALHLRARSDRHRPAAGTGLGAGPSRQERGQARRARRGRGRRGSCDGACVRGAGAWRSWGLPSGAERVAGDDGEEQGAHVSAGLGELRPQVVEAAQVGRTGAAAERVAVHLRDHAVVRLRAGGQLLRQLDRAVEGAVDVGADQLAAGVDRFAVVEVAPAARRVVMLEAEADAVDRGVARGAVGLRGVLGVALAVGLRLLTLVGQVGVDVGGRRCGRDAQQALTPSMNTPRLTGEGVRDGVGGASQEPGAREEDLAAALGGVEADGRPLAGRRRVERRRARRGWRRPRSRWRWRARRKVPGPSNRVASTK